MMSALFFEAKSFYENMDTSSFLDRIFLQRRRSYWIQRLAQCRESSLHCSFDIEYNLSDQDSCLKQSWLYNCLSQITADLSRTRELFSQCDGPSATSHANVNQSSTMVRS